MYSNRRIIVARPYFGYKGIVNMGKHVYTICICFFYNTVCKQIKCISNLVALQFYQIVRILKFASIQTFN